MLAGIFGGFLGLLLEATMISAAVRYLLPVMLTALIEPLCGVVGMLAALLVLPEFWISTAYRRDGGGPPHLAYLYGDGVCRLARIGHRGLRLVLRLLARAAYTVPPLAVALTAVAWQVVRILP
jgi:hypothetical protein